MTAGRSDHPGFFEGTDMPYSLTDWLSLFGLGAVTAMLIFYALEDRSA
jgi:hypothetical protein